MEREVLGKTQKVIGGLDRKLKYVFLLKFDRLSDPSKEYMALHHSFSDQDQILNPQTFSMWNLMDYFDKLPDKKISCFDRTNLDL